MLLRANTRLPRGSAFWRKADIAQIRQKWRKAYARRALTKAMKENTLRNGVFLYSLGGSSDTHGDQACKQGWERAAWCKTEVLDVQRPRASKDCFLKKASELVRQRWKRLGWGVPGEIRQEEFSACALALWCWFGGYSQAFDYSCERRRNLWKIVMTAWNMSDVDL